MSLKNHEDVSTQWLNLLNKVGNEGPPLRIDRGKFGKGLDTYGGFLVAHMVKNLPSMQETQVQFLIWEDALEKGMATPLQYSCLENPHGQRSLMGCSPWGHKESDTTD